MFERFLAAHADEKPGAARTDDAQRAARVEVISCERKSVKHRETLAVIQLAAHRRRALPRALPDRNTAILIEAPYLYIHNTRLRFLTDVSRRSVTP